MPVRQAEVGLIPTQGCAETIGKACETMDIDPIALAEDVAHAGTLAIPLVRRLREALKDNPAAAESVHRGATSQDLADTVMMLQAKDALALLQADLERVSKALEAMALRHAAHARARPHLAAGRHADHLRPASRAMAGRY